LRGVAEFGPLLAAGMVLYAQPVPSISIQPSPPDARRAAAFSRDGVTASAVTLEKLVSFAFGLEPWSLIMPEWFREARYDVRTTYPGEDAQPGPHMRGLGPDIRPTLREALTAKFSLVFHRESRPLETWVMRLPMDPPGRMKASPVRYAPAPGISAGGTLTRAACEPCQFSSVAGALARILSTEVADETGLEGNLEFSVMWNTGDAGSLIREWRDATGIEFSREFRPVEVLVVDSAARPDAPASEPRRFACEPSPGLRAAIEALPPLEDYACSWEQRIGPRFEMAGRYPGDIFAGMKLAEALETRPGMTREWDRALQLFTQFENAAAGAYLRAWLLMPHQKALSERLLGTIADDAPEAPWKHLGLAAWTLRHAPSGQAAFERHLGKFHRMCPANVAVAGFADAVRDPALASELSAALGRELEARTDREAIAAMPHYWHLVVRTRPEYAGGRIRRDLARVRFLNRLDDAGWAQTLLAGYTMSGDAEAAKALESLMARRGKPEALTAADAWRTRPADFAAASDRYLASIERNPDLDDAPIPAALQVAAEYARRGLRPQSVPALVEAGLATATRREAHRRLSDVPAEAAAAEAAIAAAQRESARVLQHHAARD
jgi:uncharacterized protein (TIGR03435 family)